MQVVYDPLPEAQRENLCRFHPRGQEIISAIEIDLSRDPLSRASKLAGGRYAQVYVPNVVPFVEIRIAYLVGDLVLIKVFNWIEASFRTRE